MLKNLAFSPLLLLGALNWLAGVCANPLPFNTSDTSKLDTRAANYYVAVADQNSRTVRVFPRNAEKWSLDKIYWSFTAHPKWWQNGNWLDLSDVKIRKVGTHGWIALVTASRGKVGIINITNEKRKTTLDDVMWQATPFGNPHAIERVPYNGAIVTVGSKPGKLTLYVPQDPNKVNDYSNIKKSAWDYDCPGGHGVLWDPNGGNSQAEGFLWAIGKKYLYKYKVTGKGKNTKLVLQGSPIKIPKIGANDGLGHDLQPDYSNPNILLATDTYGAYEYNTKTNKWKVLREAKKLKSFTRHPDGEYVWVTGDKGEMGQYVSFGMKPSKVDESRGWGDAEFYKARIYRTDFE